ncbi:hypothetical protein ASE37_17660 [Rhizobium sp. Root268]|nr:hypothetical protein ASC86_17745 [Rhizobium sp. Root1212]KRD22537.1 hypothetical protein ASE37_17660 [Rhizobium sp. Root268]
MCGVDHDALGPGTFTGQCREDAVEHTKAAPANEAVVKRLVRPLILGCILLLKAILDDIDDAADETAIINSGNTMRQGKMRRDPSHLALAHQKKSLISLSF